MKERERERESTPAAARNRYQVLSPRCETRIGDGEGRRMRCISEKVQVHDRGGKPDAVVCV